ncbi:sugar ABC transporter ATP-binding protein [Alkalihalobacillus sp. BA299]|uniref:sugar ABC transporter ATP-binding protein n=1 Tax=Alkalihalobacillus sp. BA299 TaxID=2815938 RepID=UPI001ADC7F1D|nr:sugar ABC transporter ATP-binding protein [Alkalihalobacillus sp. BA299]
MEGKQYVVEMQNISKSFPGVKALENVQLKVRKGTVHTLMGENGAGKSTLMKILSGMYTPDTGEIYIDGQKVQLKSPRDALLNGISIVQQELSPILDMTIGENIFLGREPLYPNTRFINYKKLYQDADQLLKRLKLNLNPKMKMSRLSIAEMQMVEIVKTVSYGSQVIIMDEPTSAITDQEVERLFEIIDQLKSEGKGIVYISHKMDEIFQISDDITVLRDGTYIDTKPAQDLDRDKLIAMMVGRNLTDMFPEKAGKEIKETILEVNNISSPGYFEDVSFTVKKGEILGISGLMGAGRTEVAEAIFGLLPIEKGEIRINGQKAKIQSPVDAINHKIAFLTEDRKGEGLFLSMTVNHNASMTALNKFTNFGFINKKQESKTSNDYRDKLRIKSYSINQLIGNLSGGNQQKVCIAKWLLTDPDILILDEPTRGIDIGAKAEIYKLMSDLAKQGLAIIMISSEMPEVIGMSDRIIVFHEGKITGELKSNGVTQEEILDLATGNTKGGEKLGSQTG